VRSASSPFVSARRRRLAGLAVAALVHMACSSGCTVATHGNLVEERPIRTLTERTRAPVAGRTLTADAQVVQRPSGGLDAVVVLHWVASCQISRDVLIERTTVAGREEGDDVGNSLLLGFGSGMLAAGLIGAAVVAPSEPSGTPGCRSDATTGCWDPRTATAVASAIAIIGGGIAAGSGLYGLARVPPPSTSIDERLETETIDRQMCGSPPELVGLELGADADVWAPTAHVDASGRALVPLPEGAKGTVAIVIRRVPPHLEGRVDAGEVLLVLPTVAAAAPRPQRGAP
jgi:hypothetical protein